MLRSWLSVPAGSGFTIRNLPYGVYTPMGKDRKRICVAIGEHVIDIARLSANGTLVDRSGTLKATSLNKFMAEGPERWAAVRAQLTELLINPRHRDRVEDALVPVTGATMHLPFDVVDFVTFFSVHEQEASLGRLIDPDHDPMLLTWRRFPIGQHGRSGTVGVSRTGIIRPTGQRKGPLDMAPVFGATARLDFEAQLGFVVGVPTAAGQNLTAEQFAEHVFGVVLLNDWTARDMQAWESSVLGPFLSKSFGTSMSPWVVPLAALDEARTMPPIQDPRPLPYLRDLDPWALDISMQVSLNGEVITRAEFADNYWTPGQQLAHLTINGAAVRSGDLFATGTFKNGDRCGSLLDLTANGSEPVRMTDGSTRTYLEDGDTVSISASAVGLDGERIGFGTVDGTIVPARPVYVKAPPPKFRDVAPKPPVLARVVELCDAFQVP